jgi:hypothetical protein
MKLNITKTHKGRPSLVRPEKNKGIAFLNNSGAVHGIQNITQDRYILYASVILK